MKVCFVHISLKLYWVPRIMALKKYFEERNVEFYVIELVGNSAFYETEKGHKNNYSWWKCLFPNISVNDVPSKIIGKAAYDELSAQNPDVVISGAIPFSCGATSVRWVTDNEKKLIVFDDVKFINLKKNAIISFIKEKLYDRVDAYFAPSETYYKELERWHFTPQNIFVGLNCIDNNFFQKKSEDEINNHPFKGFVYDKNFKYLICVARLVPIKNHRGLLCAWQKIFERYEQAGGWKLLLSGDGFMRSDLEAYIKEKNIQNIEFLGSQSQDELPFYYSISSALILPSFSETWGLVVNEAMAASLPVLISNTCNCSPDLVVDGLNGYTFNPKKCEEITESILKIMSNPDLPKMGAESRKIVEKYSIEAFSGNLYKAVNYTYNLPVKKADLYASIFMKFWNGRLNMVAFNGKKQV